VTERFVGRAWVEGAVVPIEQARVPVLDRGFLYADSVYDTVRTYDHRPFLLGDHIDRLRRSAEQLWLPVPWSDGEIEGIVDALLAGWPPGEASLRLIVTRGEGGSGLAFPEPQAPRLIVLARPAGGLPAGAKHDGVAIARPRVPTKRDGRVPPDVKSGSYLANVLTLRDARDHGGFEGLLRAKDGTWAEGTTSNLFVVRGGRLFTPGVAGSILPGVTRALVLALAAEAGVEAVEGPIDDAALTGADEIFLTASIKEVVPAVRLDGEPVGQGTPGPATRDLQRRFDAAVVRLQAAGASRLRQVYPDAFGWT
jgi:branched-subunit amino acid aminotransferase/4-amino-4-deoxychorismate lyase